MDCKIINRSENPLPAYATAQSAGMDLRANLETPITLAPLQRILIPTGISIELPAGFEGQVRPRSGLAANHGITVLNAPGTIDADYRGEIKVALINLSDTPFSIQPGDRIAQLVISRYETVNWIPSTEISDTKRGSDGFGSSGTH